MSRESGVVDFAMPAVASMESPDAQAMVRGYRQPSSLISGLRRIISSEYFPGKAWRTAKAQVLGAAEPILIVGSGVTRYEKAVHLDLDDFPNVDVIGDAHQLPFANNSFNGLICEVVLEHVHSPQVVIAECLRVLKPNASAFFIVPFLFPFHGHPADYRRWSRQGIEQDFAGFIDLEVGIHGGPCSSMVNIITEWAYVASGLRYPRGYTLIKGGSTALLFPFKFLDMIVNRFPEAHRLASTLFVLGTKPGN